MQKYVCKMCGYEFDENGAEKTHFRVGGISIMCKKNNLVSIHPADTEVNMTQLVLPTDTNLLENLLGGRLLHWIDIVGALASTRHARKTVATVSIEGVDFRHPIRKGEMVMLNARVIWTGRTSIKVCVKVKAENMYTGDIVTTNNALLTYVAMDENGQPCTVSKIEPVTEEDVKYFNEAQATYEKAKAK